MRKITLHAALIAALLLVFGAGSYAVANEGHGDIKSERLTSYQEVPALSSVAEGNFKARIDDSADEIHYELSYSDLEGTVTQSHIHFAQRSVNGGISAWLCETAAVQSPSASTPTCPAAPGGTVTGVITPAEVICAGCSPTNAVGQGIAAGEFEELVAAIRAGRTYANLHSTKWPGGEIRGQLNDDNQRDD